VANLNYNYGMKTKTLQAPKDRLNSRTRAEVDRARSNAGQPHRLKTTYTRKAKHKGHDF
jgi:hypothetical protein